MRSKRTFERSIRESEARAALESGQVIADDPDDPPCPSRLVLGWMGGRPIHVVAAENQAAAETIVVTAYEPDPRLWDNELRTKRQP
jgi:Domain of unknown function (DUF4258)